MEIRDKNYFLQNALTLAPTLVGKLLCRKISGNIIKLRITETECYMGESDLGCHASKGKTGRTAIMYESGGLSYVYLVYGMHNMFNVVCGEKNSPEAVLIRCCEGYSGPAKLTKALSVTREHNGVDLTISKELWLENDGFAPSITTKPRVGIDYAGEYWSKIPWRFVIDEK